MKTCEIIEKFLSAVFRAMICACIILLLYMISFRANNFIKNNIARSMKYHQIRFDMIQVYKILHGEDKSLKRLFSVERNHLIKIKYVNISLV